MVNWDTLPKSAYVDMSLSEYIERMKEEFNLSDKSVARYFRQKASELDPRIRTKTIKIPKEFIEEYIKKHKEEAFTP